MGCGNSLIDDEKGMIDAFEKHGHSQREIAKKINRSRCAMHNYIKDKNKTLKKEYHIKARLGFMRCSFHEGAFCPFEYSTLGQFVNVLHMVQRETLMSPGS